MCLRNTHTTTTPTHTHIPDKHTNTCRYVAEQAMREFRRKNPYHFPQPVCEIAIRFRGASGTNSRNNSRLTPPTRNHPRAHTKRYTRHSNYQRMIGTKRAGPSEDTKATLHVSEHIGCKSVCKTALLLFASDKKAARTEESSAYRAIRRRSRRPL